MPPPADKDPQCRCWLLQEEPPRALHEAVQETKYRQVELLVDGRRLRCFPMVQVGPRHHHQTRGRGAGWCATCRPGAGPEEAGYCDPSTQDTPVGLLAGAACNKTCSRIM